MNQIDIYIYKHIYKKQKNLCMYIYVYICMYVRRHG